MSRSRAVSGGGFGGAWTRSARRCSRTRETRRVATVGEMIASPAAAARRPATISASSASLSR